MENEALNEIRKKTRISSEALGKNIRKKRIEQNISQEYLAEMLDISRQSISKWENGLSEPSTKNLAQLSVIFRCDMSELLAEDVQPAGPGSFAAVGIAMESADIVKMKSFFQEMPADVLEFYDTSILLMCETEEDIAELKEMADLYAGDSTVISRGESLLELEPNRLYLLSKESSGVSFDDLFERLVRFYGCSVVAVLMSADGTDGIRGIRHVKRAGGMSVLCETEKKDRKYWSASPDSFFNYVLEPACMGYWISNFIRRAWFEKKEKYKGLLSERSYHRVHECLQDKSSHSVLDYKEEYLIRALLERIERNNLSSADYYIRFLENSDEEQSQLIRAIFKHVRAYRKDLNRLLELRELFREIRPELNGIRIWIAGCGNGLDAYVTVMLLSDYMDRYEWNSHIKIFATDVEEEIMAGAIQGYYSAEEIEGLPLKWIQKYFKSEGSGYRVNQVIRDRIIFSVHDMLVAPPFARMNLMVCRNVLSKYRIRSRKILIERFAYSLNQGGYLVLGQNEDIAELNSWFRCVDKYKGKIWKKHRYGPHYLGRQGTEQESFSTGNVIQEMLAAGMPSCIITDERYEILYIGKGASKYLQFKTGRFSQNLFDNMDIRISVMIDTALKYLKEEQEWQEVMTLRGTDGEEVDVSIHVLGQTIKGWCYYLIWFEEIADIGSQGSAGEAARKKEEKLERELEISQDKLCQALGELEETKDKYLLINEKLQSTNEELILMNDELQMVNQELTASNRKLTRMNAEYQSKMSELPDFSLAGMDFFKLMDLHVIFLDDRMHIKKMSEKITKITNIRERDLDHSITGINLMNGYLGWQEDLQTAAEGERVYRVIDGAADDRFLIEIFPYIQAEQETSGYVILIQRIEKGGK